MGNIDLSTEVSALGEAVRFSIRRPGQSVNVALRPAEATRFAAALISNARLALFGNPRTHRALLTPEGALTAEGFDRCADAAEQLADAMDSQLPSRS